MVAVNPKFWKIWESESLKVGASDRENSRIRESECQTIQILEELYNWKERTKAICRSNLRKNLMCRQETYRFKRTHNWMSQEPWIWTINLAINNAKQCWLLDDADGLWWMLQKGRFDIVKANHTELTRKLQTTWKRAHRDPNSSSTNGQFNGQHSFPV